MKPTKLFKRMLALVLLALLLPQWAAAYDFKVDGLCYNKNSDGTSVTVTYERTSSPRYSNLSGAISIPASVTYNGNTYSVTSIGNNAFYNCIKMTSVTIPNSVTSIGNNAFYICSGLTSVTIPNSVTSIGYRTFSGCSGLTSVTIPNSVTSIGDEAFYDCSGLTSVTISNSVTSISDGAFSGCIGLASVTIPNSVTSIGNNAFYNCIKMTSVDIPNSVTSIGNNAFYNCIKMTSVDIPNSVTSISGYAFRSCSGLTSVTIPNSVTSIGCYAFDDCSSLKSLVIGKSVSEFSKVTQYSYVSSQYVDYSSTFRGCDSLKKITSYAQVPGKFEGRDGFDKVPTSCILYVPKGTVETYRNAYTWNRFTNILEMESLVEHPEAVTISRPGELVEIPITLTMPDGCTLNDITIDFTYPDGLQPCTDSQGQYGIVGNGINVLNGAPVMTFVDNFSSDDAWPTYQVSGDAAQAVQANAANPIQVYTLHVAGDPYYTAGDRDLLVHVTYTDIDGDEYEAGSAQEFVTLTNIHFVRDYDINNDGMVDINDVNVLINLILGRTNAYAQRADLTGDGRFSISDLNILIDAILGKR